ncbi:hypothetical protein AKUH4B406M_07470 [Apilactobacillus kunkeei]|nr:hypothetical protein AKUH4B406M_07470 [Apilactobacillus kunkeei]
MNAITQWMQVPNVKIICQSDKISAITDKLSDKFSNDQIKVSGPGEGIKYL